MSHKRLGRFGVAGIVFLLTCNAVSILVFGIRAYRIMRYHIEVVPSREIFVDTGFVALVASVVTGGYLVGSFIRSIKWPRKAFGTGKEVVQ